MKLNEFKAWFEGYTEEMDKPTKKQWDKIKDRVAEIDGELITITIFVDRYLPPYYPAWYMGGFGPMTIVGEDSGMSTKRYGNTTGNPTLPNNDGFTSTHAMYALGKLEANYERSQQT